MKRLLLTTLLTGLYLMNAWSARAQEAGKSWTPLFNGKDLAGWKIDPRQPGEWRVENGALVGRGNAVSHLFTERGDFEGFHLRVEAKINAKGNSGVFFRSEYGLSRGNAYPAGYEAQIYLAGGRDLHLTGSLHGFVPVRQPLVRPDKWFTMEVIGDGRFITIKVDGKTTVNFMDEKNTYRKGHFALQHMANTTVAFRKIEVLKPVPPPYAVVRQGGGPTCWINASMAAVLYSGGDLSKLVRSKGKNRYEVSLYNCNDPKNRMGGGMHPIVVETDFDGNRINTDIVIRPGDQKAYWAVVLQRGVIQAVQQWDPSQSIEKPHGGGAGDALAILTGRIPARIPVRAADARKRVEAALEARRPIVFGMKNHYYAVLKSSPQEVTLYNPYGQTRTFPWEVIIGEGNAFFINASPTKAAQKDRTVWTHAKGSFVKQEGKHWTEGGFFAFVEKNRTQDYVDLHDNTRNVWVRLYDDRADIKKNGDYALLYDGAWAK